MELVTYWQRFCVPYLRAVLADRTELGASVIEYALLVAFIAIVAIGAVTFLGEKTGSKIEPAGSAL